MIDPAPTDLIPLGIAQNRRGSRRLRTRLRVDLCPLVTRESGVQIGGMQRGVALDISASGLFVGSAGYLPLGATVHLFLRLPDGPADAVVGYAKVVRSEDRPRRGYGIKLLRIKESDVGRLERYIDRRRAANRRRPPPVPAA